MEIILHRANSVKQWLWAAENGWGIEVDLRTHRGIVYLSHDVIEGDYFTEYTPSFASMYEATQNWNNTIVLDCKETGLFKRLNSLVFAYGQYIFNQYAFVDMIVPDQIFTRAAGGRVLTRRSKFENISVASMPGPVTNPKPQEEYWLDYVFSPDDLVQFADIAKDSYVVSPELHKYQSISNETTLFAKELQERAFDLTDEFIKTAFEIGFKGVCTHEPKRYASYTLGRNV
jgi:hypothetical protein